MTEEVTRASSLPPRLSGRDSRERFTFAAAYYAEHRPRYPEGLLDWLVATTGVPAGGRIADIGCGTGIASRQLARRGFDVIGIEPNQAMLALARHAGVAKFARGEAIWTGLPDAAADLVIAAQAFHHFDFEPTLAEWRRITKHDGHGAVFWYRLTANDFKRDFHLLRERYSVEGHGEEPREGGRLKKSRIIESLRSHEALRDVVDTMLRFDQRLDRAELRGRLLASSHIAPVRDEDALERDIGELFDRHAEAGRVRVAHELFAVCWRFHREAACGAP